MNHFFVEIVEADGKGHMSVRHAIAVGDNAVEASIEAVSEGSYGGLYWCSGARMLRDREGMYYRVAEVREIPEEHLKVLVEYLPVHPNE